MADCEKKIKIIGYGSQAKSWAKCLRASGWDVCVLLRSMESASFLSAKNDEFNVRTLQEWFAEQNEKKEVNSGKSLVAFLCPDDQIPLVYQNYFVPLVGRSFVFVLAHGFSVYSGEIKLNENFEVKNNPHHSFLLFAPKAIGPKIYEHYLLSAKKDKEALHSLAAAACASEENQALLLECARGLRFSMENLVWTDFEKETIGDLISEQILLCGGVLSLLTLAFEEMKKANIPMRLIKEECLTELSLISDILNQEGVEGTLGKISQAALCGASLVYSDFEKSNFKSSLQKRAERVREGGFSEDFKDKKNWTSIKEEWLKNVQKLEKGIFIKKESD